MVADLDPTEERARAERMRFWAERSQELKKDYARERRGLLYLVLSILAILGGLADLMWGFSGENWVQKPYVINGIFLLAIGISIVVGGFGRVKEPD